MCGDSGFLRVRAAEAHVNVRQVAPCMVDQGVSTAGALEHLFDPRRVFVLSECVLSEQMLDGPVDEHRFDVRIESERFHESPGAPEIERLRIGSRVPMRPALVVVAEIDVTTTLVTPMGPKIAAVLATDLSYVKFGRFRKPSVHGFDCLG